MGERERRGDFCFVSRNTGAGVKYADGPCCIIELFIEFCSHVSITTICFTPMLQTLGREKEGGRK